MPLTRLLLGRVPSERRTPAAMPLLLMPDCPSCWRAAATPLPLLLLLLLGGWLDMVLCACVVLQVDHMPAARMLVFLRDQHDRCAVCLWWVVVKGA